MAGCRRAPGLSPLGSSASAHACPALLICVASHFCDSLVLPSWDALLSFPVLVFIVALRDPHTPSICSEGLSWRVGANRLRGGGGVGAWESVFHLRLWGPFWPGREMIGYWPPAGWSTRMSAYSCTPQCCFYCELLLFIYLYMYFYFLAALCTMRDPSFPTGDQTHAPCTGHVGSSPLDDQGSPGSSFGKTQSEAELLEII